MEAIILSRIHDLLTYRRWFRTHRWADWPQERHDYDVELRALVTLARQARRRVCVSGRPSTRFTDSDFVDHPADETWTDREGQPEFNGAFR